MTTGTANGGCSGDVNERKEEIRLNVYDGTGFHILTQVPLYIAAAVLGISEDQLFQCVERDGFCEVSNPISFQARECKYLTKVEIADQRRLWNAKHRPKDFAWW